MKIKPQISNLYVASLILFLFIQVTWHGKGNEDKRGQPVEMSKAKTSWLYVAGKLIKNIVTIYSQQIPVKDRLLPII